MSAFSTSTDKILEQGLGSSTTSLGTTASYGTQTSHIPPESRRLKIAAVIVFVLLALVAAAALVGIYLSRPPPPPQEFYIVLKELESEKSVRVNVKYDKLEKIEYVTSPDLKYTGNIIYTIKVFEKGLLAHKDFQQGLCLIGHLNDTDDSAKQRSKLFKSKRLTVTVTESYLILNATIHPEVLEYTTGWRIARFCRQLPAHWIVRRLPSDPLPVPVDHVIHEEETSTSKPMVSPDDTTGEEEKFQVLTDTSAGELQDRGHDIPPPDEQGDAESKAILEEKEKILEEGHIKQPEITLPSDLSTTAEQNTNKASEEAKVVDKLFGETPSPPSSPFVFEELKTEQTQQEFTGAAAAPQSPFLVGENLDEKPVETIQDPFLIGEKLDEVEEEKTEAAIPFLIGEKAEKEDAKIAEKLSLESSKSTEYLKHLLHHKSHDSNHTEPSFSASLSSSQSSQQTQTPESTAQEPRKRRRRKRDAHCLVKCWYHLQTLRGMKRCTYYCP